MKILSISSGHDFNVSFFDSENKNFNYLKFEREISIKHLSFFCNLTLINSVIDLLKMYWGFDDNYDLIILNNCPNYGIKYHLDIKQNTKKIKCNMCERSHETQKFNKFFFINHHYSHVLSGFPLVKEPYEVDFGICIDGIGDHHETISIFENPLSKNCRRIKWIKNSIDTNSTGKKHIKQNKSYGLAFEYLGSLMKMSGLSMDFSGKIMGLQSYGKIIESDLKYINLSEIRYNFCSFTKKYFNDVNASPNNNLFLNKLATWHKICEKSVISIFDKFIKNKNSSIIYSGGFAQNTVINEAIKQKYKNTIFVPHCYDGGRSLGGIFYGCKIFNLDPPRIINYPYIQNDEIAHSPSLLLIQKTAKMLSEGKIIGWHQGRGEIGPRALGNRSILMNPAINNGKEILNKKIKHREEWRPYAASVLWEFAKDWFEIYEESPYMMRAVKVREEKKPTIPAVVHIDGTCRIQTVNKLHNDLFYKLIYEFYKITKIPLILNTSLNKGGKPISGNASDSLDILSESELDAVIFGNIFCYKNF